MQTVSTAINNTIARAQTMKVVPRVVAEWEINRFVKDITVQNSTAAEPFEPENFPIGSIVWKNRPYSGLPKAFVDQAYVSTDGTDIDWRVVDDEGGDDYKYWVSPEPSKNYNPAGTPKTYPITPIYGLDNCAPEVVYDKAYLANKIGIKLETSWTKPVRYRILVQRNGSSVWTEIADSPAMDSKGQITLYRQANGSWGPDIHYDNPEMISGIKLWITSVDKPESRAGVIELGVRYEQDITDDVVSVGVSKQRETVDFGYPVGTATANTCSITLDNTSRRYSVDNEASDLFGLIDMNAKFWVAYGIDTSDYGGSGIEYVTQGTFYADTWGDSESDATATVEATDFSKFLQETPVPECFFQDESAAIVIRDMLEMAGIGRHKFYRNPEEDYNIPYVFYDDDTSLWDAVGEVARSDHAAFGIDEDRYFVFYSKEVQWEKSTPDAVLRSNTDGLTLPNIISIDPQFEIEANAVIVRWQKLAAPKYKGLYENRNLWEPEEDIVLQSASLTEAMDATQDYFWMQPNDAKFFDYTGYVNIEGEVISYDGIQVRNGSDRKIKRKQGQYPNYTPTGKFVNCVRGVLDTEASPHYVNINGWELEQWGAKSSITGSMRKSNGGQMILSTPADYDPKTTMVAMRGSSGTQYEEYGTALTFDNGKKNEMAGLAFHLDSNGKAGYYVQLATTASISGKKRTYGEIKVYRVFSDGSSKGLPNNDQPKKDDPLHKESGGYGWDKEIIRGRQYQIDVQIDGNVITVYVDGLKVTSFTDPYGNRPTSGRWGMFVRGNTYAEFEYAYAIRYNENAKKTNIAMDSFQDRLEGSYVSGHAMKERYRSKSKKAAFFFDEFGPVIHEVREFDIKYSDETKPAFGSWLFMHIDWQVEAFKFAPSAFGAKFYVANAYRDQAVLRGEDTVTVPGQTLMNTISVVGSPLLRGDERKHKVVNTAQVRRRGGIEMEITNPWVQSKEQAEDVGEFIIDHWSKPNDVINAEVIGHPGWQTGDVVGFDFPEKDMLPGRRYHIIAIEQELGEGLTTNLTLRRARFAD